MNILTALFSIFMFVFPISKNVANAITVLLVISSISVFIKYKKNESFKMILQQPVARALILFLSCVLITIPFSGKILISAREYFHYIGDIAPFFALLLLKIIAERYAINIRIIIHSFFVGLVVACFYAIYQFCMVHSFGIKAFYSNQAYFAFVLEVAMPLALSMAVAAQTMKQRGLYGILFALFAVAILLTHERGPWLGTIAGLIVVLFLYRNSISKRNMKLILASVVLFAVMTSPLYWDRMQTIVSFTHSSNAQRIHIWQYTLQMIQDHPLVGIGLEQYGEKYVSYIDPMEKLIRYAPHAHNSYLMIFAEAGVVGFLGFIYLLFSISKNLLYIKDQANEFGLAYGFMGILCAVLITAFVDNAFFTAYVSKLFWLLLGLLLYSSPTRCSHNE